jgi:hypothetical protein
VIAAGGVGLTLLTRPVFARDHPAGSIEIVAAIVGLLVAASLVLAAAYVLARRRLGFSVNASATLSFLTMATQPQPNPAPTKIREPLPQTIFFSEKRGDTAADPPLDSLPPSASRRWFGRLGRWLHAGGRRRA